MRLSHLSLQNYHGFEQLSLDLPASGPTVLIGKNGSGKSTVLDAIAMSLAHFAGLALSPPRRRSRGLSLRLPMTPEEVRHDASTASVLALFASEEGRFAARATYGTGHPVELDDEISARPLDELVCDGLIPRLETVHHAAVPMLAYYRPNRGVGVEAVGRKTKLPAHPQLSAYLHAFGPQVGPFQETLRWFRSREDQENQERLREDPEHRNPWLQAVRDAIERFMSALASGRFHNLRVVRRMKEEPGGSPWGLSDESIFVIDKETLSLPLDSLSDGERGALLLVADLAMRMVVTHPGAAEPLHGAGIVLIDELDVHLHPGWQRRILPALGSVFPNLQIITTTHSPQVLSTLHPESVVVLEDFAIQAAPLTYGKDSNSLLRDAMGTTARPEELARKLVQAHILVDRERYREAEAVISEIAADLGELDPEVVRLRVLTHIVDE